jgi:cysteine-rich CWC protein
MPEEGRTVDPARCPLCGVDNACAMAADPAARDCWCADATISARALERVPAEAKRVACVCARCASDSAERD